MYSSIRDIDNPWTVVHHPLTDVGNVYVLDKICAVQLTSNKIKELIGWQDPGELGNMIATPPPPHSPPQHPSSRILMY